MQSVVKFISLLQVGAICLQYSHDVIGVLGLKLQYSCICCCIVCAFEGKGQTFVLVLLGLVSDKSQEEEHARLWDDTNWSSPIRL